MISGQVASGRFCPPLHLPRAVSVARSNTALTARFIDESALRNSVLPRTPECSANRLAAHRLHGRDYSSTELGVPIEDQKSLWLFAAFPSFLQLQGNPKRVGIASHVAVQDPTPVVADHEEAVQNAEGQGQIGRAHV